MNREFWTGKRVLVTGHTGFKGSWLSLWLQSLGADLRDILSGPRRTQVSSKLHTSRIG